MEWNEAIEDLEEEAVRMLLTNSMKRESLLLEKE